MAPAKTKTALSIFMVGSILKDLADINIHILECDNDLDQSLLFHRIFSAPIRSEEALLEATFS